VSDLIEAAGYLDDTYHRLLASLVKEANPGSVLEIGVGNGSSMVAMASTASRRTSFVGVDMRIQEGLRETLDAHGIKAELVETLDFVEIPKRRADFVHLDADHSTIGVFRELLQVDQWNEPPKVISIHDWIDPYTKWGVTCFIMSTSSPWTVEIHPEVFNGCVVLRRGK